MRMLNTVCIDIFVTKCLNNKLIYPVFLGIDFNIFPVSQLRVLQLKGSGGLSSGPAVYFIHKYTMRQSICVVFRLGVPTFTFHCILNAFHVNPISKSW